jgi:hypothetical protein
MYEESHAISIAPPETVGYNTPTQRKTQRRLVLDVLLCNYAYYIFNEYTLLLNSTQDM